MARVPISEGNRVGLAPLPGANFRAADMTAGDRAIGEGMQRFGQALGGFAEDQARLAAQLDEAAAKEAANAVSKFYAEKGYTGDSPYYSMQGKSALEARTGFETGLDDFIEATRGNLRNDLQRRMFDDGIAGQRVVWGTQIARHADSEIKAYNIEQSASRAGIAAETAKLSYLDNPEEGERQISTALGEIDALARLQGWSPERLHQEKLKAASDIYGDIGSSVLNSDPVNGPGLVKALVERHGAAMTADTRNRLIDAAQIQTRMNEVEERRRQAEAERIAREQRADAKDRAESVARNLDDGVPVGAEELASALGDARTAQDPAIEERIRQGGLKNALTLEWAGRTPDQLQARINTLSAKITKEGEKASADTIVERDHLIKLRDRSSSELATDGLSWGARNLGVDPGKLDLNDEGSIANRLNAATLVARRTGRKVPPITDEEAARLAPLVAGGNVRERTSLAVQLAKFGPMAGLAAQRVAPNNPAFLGLVGLAGHGNKGVAASRVNQVVAGQEVLKLNKGLIKADSALREFNQRIGGALQFLPGVKAGVFENAKAILANDANERGVTEWGEAQPRWFMAINSALGAYMQGGKQIGGLVTLNGAITVAPENMAEDDFLARISRSRATQLKAAHNGTPVYANGTSPTASEIKAMQLVPVRDGVYRIKGQGGWLSRQGGGYYEIDARRLPGR
jgi:hypothetical protein